MNTLTFETGATTHAVNDLILFTDNTRSLAEYRDEIYTDWAETGNFGTTNLGDRFAPLLREAQKQYRKEMPTSYKHIWLIDGIQISEYCHLYVKDFENWKQEHNIS